MAQGFRTLTVLAEGTDSVLAPHGHSQLSVTLASEDLTPPSGLRGHQTCIWCIQAYRCIQPNQVYIFY